MLRKRVINASVWIGVSRVAAQVISLARVVVLSRLLAPDDFGTFAVALTLLSILAVLTQTGFNQAMVHSGKSIDRFADVVWTFHLIRGIGICVVLVLIGPAAANYFGIPEAAPLIQAIGACSLVRAFVSMGHIYQQKDVLFRVQAIQNTVGVAVDAVIVIALAAIVGGPWALVFGLIVGELAKTTVSYVLHPYRPRLAFNRAIIRELAPYGRWIYISSLILLANSAGPALVVGKLLGTTWLGIYQMSSRLAGMASTEFSGLLSQIAFPVYSGIRESRDQIARVFARSVAIVTAATFPIALVLIVFGVPVVKVLLGPKWEEVSGPLAVLAIEGVLRALASTAVPVFRGLGVPSYETQCHSFRTLLFVVSVVPLTLRFGLVGTAGALTLSSIGWLAMSVRLVRTIAGVRLGDMMRPLAPVFAATAGMALVLVVTRGFANTGPLALICSVAAGLIAYVVIAWLSGLKRFLV